MNLDIAALDRRAIAPWEKSRKIPFRERKDVETSRLGGPSFDVGRLSLISVVCGIGHRVFNRVANSESRKDFRYSNVKFQNAPLDRRRPKLV